MRARLVLASVVTILLGPLLLAPHVSAGPPVEGSGNGVADLGSSKNSVIVKFTTTGTSPFAISPVYAKGKSPTPWLKANAPLRGSVFSEKHSAALVGAKVVAPDQWTLQVVPLSSAPKVSSGSTPLVFKLPKTLKGDSTRTFIFQGDGEIVVFPISARGMSGFPVVSTSGKVKKKIVLPRGTKYMSVTGVGSWKLRK